MQRLITANIHRPDDAQRSLTAFNGRFIRLILFLFVGGAVMSHKKKFSTKKADPFRAIAHRGFHVLRRTNIRRQSHFQPIGSHCRFPGQRQIAFELLGFSLNLLQRLFASFHIRVHPNFPAPRIHENFLAASQAR